MITDTHCHITCDKLYENVDEIISEALEKGVDLMMVICTNKEEYLRARKLKEKYPDILKVAFGYYPGDVEDVTDEDLAYLDQEARAGHLDVLGEIGLDYYWDITFKEEQKELFIRQIQLANETNLPISIHMRDASRDCMDILEAYAKTPIIFHCFSGSLEIMKEALKLNSLISFAGPITYKNNKQGPVNVAECPADRILSETDSPYLSPIPYRGKTNHPAYVHATMSKIAEIKDIEEDVLCKQIRENFLSLFQSSSANLELKSI